MQITVPFPCVHWANGFAFAEQLPAAVRVINGKYSFYHCLLDKYSQQCLNLWMAQKLKRTQTTWRVFLPPVARQVCWRVRVALQFVHHVELFPASHLTWKMPWSHLSDLREKKWILLWHFPVNSSATLFAEWLKQKHVRSRVCARSVCFVNILRSGHDIFSEQGQLRRGKQETSSS